MGSVITVSQEQYDMVRGKAESFQDILISSGKETTEGDIYIIPFISNNYYWFGSAKDKNGGSWTFDLGDVDRSDRILIDYPLGDLNNEELDQLWDVSKIFEVAYCLWIDGYYEGDPLISNGYEFETLFSNGFNSFGNHPESIELAWITGEVRDPTIESAQFGLIDLSQLDLNKINSLNANQFLSSYGDLITSRADIIAAPLITGPSGNTADATDNISIEENNTTIYTFKSDQPVTWSLNGGEYVCLFAINSTNGELSFSSSPA